jgi:hypothetical protein
MTIAARTCLQSYDFFTERYWIWAGVGFMTVFGLVCFILTGVGLKHGNGAHHMATVSCRLHPARPAGGGVC